MEQWSGKVAIVTGASGGIGSAIAEALVRAGVKVVGVARRVDPIRKLAGKLKCQKGVLHAMECDVRKEEDILKVFEWVEKELGGADILVNNAGLTISDRIIDSPTENYRKLMDVNVIAVAIFIREAVRSMRKRNARGHIFNINSVAGHNAEIITFPVNIYCATKYAITAMTQTVTIEIAEAKLPIKVTSVSPGAVKTDLMVEAGVAADDLQKLPILDGKDIANSIIFALGTPPHVQVKELTVTPLAPLSSTFDS